MSNDPIACEEIVHRAITKRRWLDDRGQVTPEAFMRRVLEGGVSEPDLSVLRRALAPWLVSRPSFKKVFGAASLHVGHVRSLGNGIDVIATPRPAMGAMPAVPEHASVLNLPDPVIEYEAAEVMASKLRRQCRKVE